MMRLRTTDKLDVELDIGIHDDNWHITLPEDELREWLEDREDGRVKDDEPLSFSDRFEPLLST